MHIQSICRCPASRRFSLWLTFSPLWKLSIRDYFLPSFFQWKLSVQTPIRFHGEDEITSQPMPWDSKRIITLSHIKLSVTPLIEEPQCLVQDCFATLLQAMPISPISTDKILAHSDSWPFSSENHWSSQKYGNCRSFFFSSLCYIAGWEKEHSAGVSVGPCI